MNSDVMHSRVQMDELILKNLVTEVRETVATDVVFSKPRNRSFGAVQLWNMRRRSRYAGHPRKNPTIITGFGF
ncbi:MAG TPA: hypothetical protein VK518_15430 [Puia sp.]|nr:hypothetical protein [Puia sp.]